MPDMLFRFQSISPAGPTPASLVLCSNYGTNAGNQPYQGQVVAQLTAGGTLTLNRIDNMGNLILQNAMVEAHL